MAAICARVARRILGLIDGDDDDDDGTGALLANAARSPTRQAAHRGRRRLHPARRHRRRRDGLERLRSWLATGAPTAPAGLGDTCVP